MLLFGAIVCLASYKGIRVITGTSSLRIAASPTGNILARTYVQTGDNAIRASGSATTLSFAERVSYQRAIEEVYLRHRIWPKEGPDTKPALEAIMSKAPLERRLGITRAIAASRAIARLIVFGDSQKQSPISPAVS